MSKVRGRLANKDHKVSHEPCQGYRPLGAPDYLFIGAYRVDQTTAQI